MVNNRVNLNDLNWKQPPSPHDPNAIGTIWTPEAIISKEEQPEAEFAIGLLQSLDALILFFKQEKKRLPKRIFVPAQYRQQLLDDTNKRLPENRQLHSVIRLGEYEIVYFQPRAEFEHDDISIFVR